MANPGALSGATGSNSSYFAELQEIWLSTFHQFSDSEGPDGYNQNSPANPQGFTNDERLDICKRLVAVTRDPDACLGDLSDTISIVLPCQFFHGENIDATTACTHATDLLTRLPHTSSALNMAFLNDAEAITIRNYCRERPSGSLGNTIDWDYLSVTSYINRIVGHFALLLSILLYDGLKTEPWTYELSRNITASAHMEAILNKIASLIDTASFEISKTTETSSKIGCFLVKAFLWTTWQKCITLFSFWQLHVTVYSLNERDSFILENIHVQMPTSLGSQSICERLDIRPPDYICRWAFEALRSNQKTQVLDFRLFLARLRTQFGSLPPRCLIDRGLQCDGKSPYNCQRFVGGEVEDQSAHDLRYRKSGRNCERLFWDEHSYKGVKGGRAVSLYSNTDGCLRYVAVSKSTLVISHVWIHGQGGRPETGMNSCLHERYSCITKAAGCDSYWIDTACIPSDHLLRKEAILEINTTFLVGKLTLVCDRDLMAIDVSNLDLDKQELILATLLMCDWNLRAWTMLEAFKGWRNLHILCMDNKIVPVYETLQSILRNGQIDICCAFLGSTHLIPRMHRSNSWALVGEEPETIQLGPARFLNVDKAGSLLSYRQASRPGDEIVIWSLICGSEVCDNAETFWTQPVYGWGLSSQYLISSAPRLQNCPGFSWAPARPNIMPPESDLSEDYIPPLEMESEHVALSSTSLKGEGLVGDWFVSIFDTNRPPLSDGGTLYPRQVLPIVARYTPGYKWMALLQAASMVMAKPKRPIPYLWRSCNRIVAVVGSNDHARWEWKGAYAWNLEIEDLPAFEYQRIKLT
jgi:hypothetical protein